MRLTSQRWPGTIAAVWHGQLSRIRPAALQWDVGENEDAASAGIDAACDE
jgi:hypothetical protein